MGTNGKRSALNLRAKRRYGVDKQIRKIKNSTLIGPLQFRHSLIAYHQKVMTNEEVKARNLKRARKQVKYWEKESSRNQNDIARLKTELDQAFARGKDIVGNLADAKEYLDDLEQAKDT